MNQHAVQMLEIVGPAGAGKSSLSTILNERCPQIVAGISIWKQRRISLTKSVVFSLPTLTRMSISINGRRFEEGKQIVRLQALYRRLGSEFAGTSPHRGRPVPTQAFVIDEGAVFALSKLHVDRQHREWSVLPWEEKYFDSWARLLDKVIWLDASDDILIERIRRRNKRHRMKHSDDAEIVDFLAQYRQSYANVISQFKQRGGIEVWKFNTERESLEEIGLRLTQQIQSASSRSLDQSM